MFGHMYVLKKENTHKSFLYIQIGAFIHAFF